MIRGLRSPCMNARYPIDHVDRLGRVLRSFDGVFEFEREREFYYIEYNMRSLRVLKKNKDGDSIRECRVVRTLANMRKLLNDFGRQHNLPRRSVRVDEDFWYMRGENDSIL